MNTIATLSPEVKGEGSSNGKLPNGVKPASGIKGAALEPEVPAAVVSRSLAKNSSRRRRFPSSHSEKNATALLCADWSDTSERLAVQYRAQTVDLEFTCEGRLAGSGAWQWEVRRDDEILPPVTAWRSTCWAADEDVDYLELEIQLAHGLRMQRQLVLARKDHFLLLADAVIGDRPGKIEYRATLPLGPGVSFQGAEGREGFLVAARKRLALILPLALPEWRGDQRVGDLTASPQGLELRQAAQGPRLFAPLFFDLDARRLSRRLTWRQLTVAEALVIQPPEVAVGYRVAVADQQWLIYRSLGPKGNRTLLGHNLATETLVARFHRTGEVESIIEIE